VADALAETLLDGFADTLADLLAGPLALAVEVGGTLGVPTLTRRVTGVADATEAPASGTVPMMVLGLFS